MSYRIEYRVSSKDRKNRWRILVLTMIWFTLFLFLAHSFWPEGATRIHSVFHGFKNAPEVSALENLAEELIHGETVADVFSGFFHILLP